MSLMLRFLPTQALAKFVESIGDAKVVAHNAEFDCNIHHASSQRLSPVGEYLDRSARSCANRASPHEIASLASILYGLSARSLSTLSRRCRRRGNLAPSSASCLQVSPRCRRRLCARSPIWRLLTSGRRGWYSEQFARKYEVEGTKMFHVKHQV